MRTIALHCIACLGVAALVAPATAQSAWPTGPVKVIVPYPAGATADGLSRLLSEHLTAIWKQPIVTENRTGAGGNVGAEAVARAAPDGYTLLHSPTPVFTINPFIYKKLSFDATQFKPITVVAASSSVLAVSHKLGVGTVPELIAKAKADPGKVSYASQGNGSTSHVTGAIFEHKTGIRIGHVPYRGSAPAMNDMVGGHVDMMFDNLFSSLAQHRAGTVRIIATCTPQRLAVLPDVPTMIEQGFPEFVSIAYFGYLAPPGTPDAIVNKVYTDIADTLKKPEVRERIERLGATVVGNTPAEMGKLLESERASWSAAIRNANIPQVE